VSYKKYIFQHVFSQSGLHFNHGNPFVVYAPLDKWYVSVFRYRTHQPFLVSRAHCCALPSASAFAVFVLVGQLRRVRLAQAVWHCAALWSATFISSFWPIHCHGRRNCVRQYRYSGRTCPWRPVHRSRGIPLPQPSTTAVSIRSHHRDTVSVYSIIPLSRRPASY